MKHRVPCPPHDEGIDSFTMTDRLYADLLHVPIKTKIERFRGAIDDENTPGDYRAIAQDVVSSIKHNVNDRYLYVMYSQNPAT